MTIILSDGFEDGTLNAWTVTSDATVQSLVKLYGDNAVAIASDGFMSKAVSALSFVHEQIRFKLSALPQNGETLIPLVFVKTSVDEWAVQLSFNKSSEGIYYWAVWSAINGGVYGESDGGEVPNIDEWHTLDLIMYLNASGYIKVLLDNNPIINVSGDLSGETISKVQCLAWNSYASPPTLYVDNVVIDDIELNRLFVEGFESGDISRWNSSSSTDVSASTDMAKNGTYSLKVYITQAISPWIWKSTKESSDVYARCDVYFGVAPSDTVQQFLRLSGDSGNVSLGVYTSDGTNWQYYVDGDSLWDIWGSVTPNTWHTFELRRKTGSGTGIVQAWVDGVEILNETGLTVSGTTKGLFTGIIYTNNYSGTAYIDNVIVSTSYIGTDSQIFTDDFSSMGLTNWTSSNGSPSVQEVSGDYVLQTVASQYVASKVYKTLSSSYQQGYIQFKVNFNSLPSDGDYIVFGYIADNSGNAIARLVLSRSGSTYTLTVENIANSQDYSYTWNGFSAQTWYTIELGILINSSTGVIIAYIDGQEVIAQSNIDTDIGTNVKVNELNVGIHSNTYAASNITVYYDNVLFSDSFIGMSLEEVEDLFGGKKKFLI
jgi:hypothetical protein